MSEFEAQEQSVPPLPTEPFTVIEPHWKDGEGPSQPKVIRFALTLHEDGHWRGLGWFRDAATLQAQITGFKVLSSPEFTTGGKLAGLTAEEREKLAYLVEHAAYSSTLDIFVIEWFEKHGSALAAKLEEKP